MISKLACQLTSSARVVVVVVVVVIIIVIVIVESWLSVERKQLNIKKCRGKMTSTNLARLCFSPISNENRSIRIDGVAPLDKNRSNNY